MVRRPTKNRAADAAPEAPPAPVAIPSDAGPPAGPPWDVPLASADLVFVDLEMTGLDATLDRVIEICAVRTHAGIESARLVSLVRPDDARSGNVHIHGIEAADLASAPVFAELAGAVEGLLDGAVLVAHAAEHDAGFLEAELGRAGRPRRIPFFLDTLTLSRRAFALPSHRLGALVASLGLPAGRAHRAEDDVNALRALFDKTVAVLAPTTPRDLWHVRVGERHTRPDVLEAAFHARDSARPVLVRYRPRHRPAEDLTMCITSVRTDLEPPRVLGYLLPSRGRRELRADRILAIEPT